jgi:hypothetical protein
VSNGGWNEVAILAEAALNRYISGNTGRVNPYMCPESRSLTDEIASLAGAKGSKYRHYRRIVAV